MATLPLRSERSNVLHSDHVFRRLVESVVDYAIFMLDPDGYIATWNPGAERFKGYKADEIIGKHFSVFYPEEDKAKPAFELKEAGRVGRFEDEGWRLRKDGSRFWANVVITRVLDDDGKLLGFGKVTRDLTERREAEQRYRLLIEGVTDYAIYSLDAHGNVTSWNSGAERIKGYKADEIIGQHFSRFYVPEDVERGMPETVLRRAAERGHYEAEGYRVRKDGTRFWSSVVVTPLFDHEGKLSGFSKITRDVTERKKLMDELQQHAAELELRIAEREQANAELEAFSYSVSHDLRAPLRAIAGFADALREDYGAQLDDTAMDYLQQIINASGRMNRLVQDLLNYSRLGRGEVLAVPVNVSAALHAARTQLGDTGGEIVLNVPEEAFVMAHEAIFTQVLANLISNGLKFHAPEVKPRVEVSAQKTDGHWRIFIRDNGIGIAPQHHARIFKVFERLHGAEEYPGTGIGLAIVKRGIDRMGGHMGFESNEGKGSTFWVELPARES